MKPTQTALMRMRFDCRPSASTIPMGSEPAMPETPMMVDKRNPPSLADSTGSRPIASTALSASSKATTQNSHQSAAPRIPAPTAARNAIPSSSLPRASAGRKRMQAQPMAIPTTAPTGPQSEPPQMSQ